MRMHVNIVNIAYYVHAYYIHCISNMHSLSIDRSGYIMRREERREMHGVLLGSRKTVNIYAYYYVNEGSEAEEMKVVEGATTSFFSIRLQPSYSHQPVSFD